MKTRSILAESMMKRNRRPLSIRESYRYIFESPLDDAPKLSSGPGAMVDFLNGPGKDKKVRNLLSAGTKDGKEVDEKLNVDPTSKKIGTLVPTQIEIELMKSISYPLCKLDACLKMISGGIQKIGKSDNNHIICSGNLIIDGHHRWSSLFSVAGSDGEIAAYDLNFPSSDAASVLAAAQVAIASTIGTSPVPTSEAGALNILGKSEKEIAKMIWSTIGKSSEVGVILSDEYVSSAMASKEFIAHFGISDKAVKKALDDKKLTQAKKEIVLKVANNLSKMKQPAAGSPPRTDMPQMDKSGGGVQGVLGKLELGSVNFTKPFVKDDVKESNKKRDNVILERWQHLAGIV